MRQKLVIHAATFLLLVFVVDRVFASILAAGFARTRTGEMGGLVNAALSAQAEVVAVGSSRAWRHYDTAVLSAALGLSSYNAGCDGQGTPYVRGLVDLLVRTHVPRLLIIDAEPTLLTDEQRFLDRATVLAPFLERSEVVRDILYARGFFEPLKYLSHSFRYNGKPLAILKNLYTAQDSHQGFNPLDRELDTTALPVPEPLIDAIRAPNPDLLRMLEETIAEARQAGSRIVLVTGPRWSQEGQDDAAYAEVRAAITSIAARQGVPYIRITLETDPVFRDSRLFADRAHLNRVGARLFTKRLVERLSPQGSWKIPFLSEVVACIRDGVGPGLLQSWRGNCDTGDGLDRETRRFDAVLVLDHGIEAPMSPSSGAASRSPG